MKDEGRDSQVTRGVKKKTAIFLHSWRLSMLHDKWKESTYVGRSILDGSGYVDSVSNPIMGVPELTKRSQPPKKPKTSGSRESSIAPISRDVQRITLIPRRNILRSLRRDRSNLLTRNRNDKTSQPPGMFERISVRCSTTDDETLEFVVTKVRSGAGEGCIEVVRGTTTTEGDAEAWIEDD